MSAPTGRVRPFWRAPLGIGLIFWSVLLPPVAFLGLAEPLGVAFDDPGRAAYYRQALLAVVVSVTAALAALLLLARPRGPFWLRTIGLVGGATAIVVNLFYLATLASLCGLAVLWGPCAR